MTGRRRPPAASHVASARVAPSRSLEVLSQVEVSQLRGKSLGSLHEVFRRCALAVLNSGTSTDDARAVLEQYRDFDIRIVQQARGVKLEVVNAPPIAFVDGKMIQGIKELLFAVLRDIIYIDNEIHGSGRYDLGTSEGITDAVFHILRNARVLKAQVEPRIAVCWGGHSISREEYDYTKEVGYELGLRGLNVCTGCGPGAMKGPMKGATIGHSKQRIRRSRYVGITEPGIIAAESPNPIVNELVIMPDIEKRLEAFVRAGHGIVAFPGGAGTAEELLYLLGVLLHPQNVELPFPVIFTGPRSSADYFRRINDFIGATLGTDAQRLYRIIVGDPVEVARAMVAGIDEVRRYRLATSDAFYFNWSLTIDGTFQHPFEISHENMAALELHPDMERHALAANLRRAFSGIVAGNVKDHGIRLIEKYGEFEIRGDARIMRPLDDLLASFVAQKRMRLPGSRYVPCYRIVA
ncbi:MAG: nucleotide 5'-monophosphate nucleosidase PpnN [Gammaproteobacteria bacterium]